MGIGCPAAALWLERVQLGTFRWMCPLLILDSAWFCSNRFLYMYTTQKWYMKNIPELWFGHMSHLHFRWHFFISIIIQQFSGLGCARSSLGFPTLPMEWSGTIAVARYGSWQGHSKHQQVVSDMDRYSFKRLVAFPIPSKISKTMVK